MDPFLLTAGSYILSTTHIHVIHRQSCPVLTPPPTQGLILSCTFHDPNTASASDAALLGLSSTVLRRSLARPYRGLAVAAHRALAWTSRILRLRLGPAPALALLGPAECRRLLPGGIYAYILKVRRMCHTHYYVTM